MSGSNPNDDTARTLTREFLRRKHDQAFEFARELATSGDKTRIGDLGRVHLETVAECDRLRAERDRLDGALRETVCRVAEMADGDRSNGDIRAWAIVDYIGSALLRGPTAGSDTGDGS